MSYTVTFPFNVAKRRYEAGAAITPDDLAAWVDDKGMSIADAKVSEMLAKGHLVEIKVEPPKAKASEDKKDADTSQDRKSDEGESPKVAEPVSLAKPPRR